MTQPVEIKLENKIAWITLDSPPVNATSTPVRAALLRAVEKAQTCDLAVLRCAGKTFIAGGDMSEFDAPPMEPHLPDLVNAIESSQAPFVALLHGHVLGGGFEIAMACAFRIAKPGTSFGLPEVKLGLIPGAGGTQRAPRLLGWPLSIDMTCLGKISKAEDLFTMGAIDAISSTPEKLVESFRGKPPAKISERPLAQPSAEVWTNFVAKVKRAAKGQQAPLHNLKALAWAVEDYGQAQPRERALHLDLRQSAESRALRHVFFAERTLAKPTIINDLKPAPLAKIAVVGGGLMGCGIAATCLHAGYQVSLIERDAAAAQNARDRVQKLLQGALNRGKISNAGFQSRKAALKVNEDFALAHDANLAIEAVFEDLVAKQAVFSKLTQHMSSEAIFATNTSYLNPDHIFQGISNPERCLGLHFFSPAHLMKLVEVIKADRTNPQSLATGFAFARRLGKTPVLAGICDGFIGNRILAAYRRAAEYMLADGALPAQIDQAMRNFGMAMGPFEAQDMAGLQIAEANRRRLDASRDPAERYVAIADQVCALGFYGRRTGKGWYLYEAGSATQAPNPTVEALIVAYSVEHEIERKTFNEQDIQSQLLAAMANEGARLVEEGIAETEAAVDLVKIAGYGFPRWRGGPMHFAASQGKKATQAALKALMTASPNSWALAKCYQETAGGEP